MDWLVIWFLSRSLRPIGNGVQKIEPVVIICLNTNRFKADLEELNRHPNIRLLSLPPEKQIFVNVLWLADIGKPTSHSDFIAMGDPVIRKSRDGLYRYLKRVLTKLCKKREISGLLSCSFYYRHDRDWERGAHDAGIPFFVLNKENMKDPVIQEDTIQKYRDWGFCFTGTRLIVGNKFQERVVLKADVCPKHKVSVIGNVRTDVLVKKSKKPSLPSKNIQLVHFSIHHCIGMYQLPKGDSKSYFSISRQHGFVEYFDIIHQEIARFAMRNPEISVVINTKWGSNWLTEIDSAIQRGLGVDPKEISNLEVTDRGNAINLIANSTVVTGINSTTLLEAKLLNRPVIVPLFAEAAGKYFEKHIYFKNYLDTVFNVVRSPELLETEILREINGETKLRPIPKGMAEEYLGVIDGTAAEKVAATMIKDINEMDKLDRNQRIIRL